MGTEHVSYICPRCGKQRWQEVRYVGQQDRRSKLALLERKVPVCGVCHLGVSLMLRRWDISDEEVLLHAYKG
jgi:hypothetical protein